ncbi:MAG: hypothetical protein AAB092_07190, partial [Chloroflexota bacterium]
IENEASVEVCAVAVAPTLAQNWGGDKLGAEVTLPPGESHTIQVGAGDHDFLILDCDFEPIEEEYEVVIDSDSTYTISG